MKCDLCGKEKDEIIEVKRRFLNIEKTGYICKSCYKNFYLFSNKIVLDKDGKWWYVSDPRKFPLNWKLTFALSAEQAFREFNPYGRIFEFKSGEKVSYFWVIKPGNKKKFYSFDPGIPGVARSPKELLKMRRYNNA